jgi:hypothetical protein
MDSYIYELEIRIPGAFESTDMQILANVWSDPSLTLVRLTLKPNKMQYKHCDTLLVLHTFYCCAELTLSGYSLYTCVLIAYAGPSGSVV